MKHSKALSHIFKRNSKPNFPKAFQASEDANWPLVGLTKAPCSRTKCQKKNKSVHGDRFALSSFLIIGPL